MDKNRNDSIVSTAYAFAKVIGLQVEQEFASEGDNNPTILLGVIGSVKEKKFDTLVKRLSSDLKYTVRTMKVNNSIGRVGLATGGGFVPIIIQEAKEKGCTTYITGSITPNSSEYSKQTYPAKIEEVKKIGINIIGCSHYLTEKWAMEFSVPFFQKFCDSEFIEDKIALKRLE